MFTESQHIEGTEKRAAPRLWYNVLSYIELTSLSSSSVWLYPTYVQPETYSGEWDSAHMLFMITLEYIGQIFLQYYVLRVNIALFVCASETAVLFVVLIQGSNPSVLLAHSWIHMRIL